MRYRVDVHADAHTRLKAMADDVLRGLSGRPRSLPPKYFYDAAGSRLFDEITRLPEYYLTRVEDALLDTLAPALMRTLAPREVVELGSGFSVKTRRLLDARGGGPLRYTPVDVDETTVAASAQRLLATDPALEVHAVIGDFERHLVHVPVPSGRRLVLFLGSTIGNLDPPERRALLTEVRRLLRRGDRLLLGVDLVKDTAVLEAAYNDAAGVTAAFNRNILSVINRSLGGDFRPELFRHHAWYNAAAQRIEMHLVSERAQTVRVLDLGLTLELAPGETIWTESSYKFTRASARAMLVAAGLRLDGWHTDGGERFALAVAAPRARRHRAGHSRRVSDTPTPTRFYVHDDLTEDVRARHGADSAAFALARELLALVRRDAARVWVLTLDEQLEALVGRGAHAPFAQAVGIGRAGERVARQVHARAGWFPAIRRIDLTREEDGRGGYAVVSPTGVPLAEQLAGVETAASLAIVDDTIFSGITLRQVLEALAPAVRARTHAFCLRCVAESLPPLRALCPVTPGFAAAGHLLDEVSFINASGLVRRGSIRRAGLPPLAFFERPEWMRAWFPGHADAVIDCCRRLNRLLEPTGEASLTR